MTAPNRVDELRKRYHENPRRFFAPLANEYRKTGFVDRAILLCEKHLGEQPGNMNGLVVYGQCLFETGRLDEARVPFEMALGLDPENLIALRHLGDIARLSGDQPTARNWYQKLLEFDRRNDEVSALLAEVGGGEAEAPAAASQAPSIISVASSVSVAGAAEPLGMIEMEPPAPAPRAQELARAEELAIEEPPTRVDPSAKTVEVTARPARSTPPPRRASLLDVSFDFGELGVDAAPSPALPPPPAPLLPAEAAEYGFAAPEPTASFEDALDEILVEAPSASAPAPVDARPAFAAEPDDSLTMSPLVETSDKDESLGELAPIEGLLQADFSAEVSPLADLESTEFEGGEAEPLAELESVDFQPPARDTAALEGLETTEFTPPSFSAVPDSRLSSEIEIAPDDAFGVSMSGEFDAPAEPSLMGEPSAVSEPAWPMDLGTVDGVEDPLEPAFEPEVDAPMDPPPVRDVRASIAGLPLLEPLGTPTPMATPTVDDLPMLPSLEDAETVRIDTGALRQRMETPATFVTETMAQVYVQQGHTDKAIAVYKQLVSQSPDDAQLRARLRALEAPMPELASAPAPAPAPTPAPTPVDLDREPIAESAPLAAQMPEPPSTPTVFEVDPPSRPSRPSLGFDTPLTSEPVDEPAPANAMLSAMSFDGLSLTTPKTPASPMRRATPVAAIVTPEPVATGPSAREFFAGFLHRAATATAGATAPAAAPVSSGGPSVGGQLLSPLDEVFGTDVRPDDEAAAHRLAGVGATSGPSGGSALDSIFGEGPSAPMPSATPARGSITRASEKLRFDQFFASSTPVQGSAAMRETESAPEVAPEAALPVEPSHGPDAEPERAGEDDDLDQFQGWLRGLTS